MAGLTTSIRAVWEKFFFYGCTAERLGLTRIGLGLGLLAFHAFQFQYLDKLRLDGARFFLSEPIWYFRVLGVEWHDPVALWTVFAILMAATLAFALGWFTRSSLIVVLLGIFYLKGMRDSVAGDVHHRYLIPFNILIFLLLSRCGEVFSLDARRRRKQGSARPIEEWEASWPIKAGQLYIALFYFWSTIAKHRMSGIEWFGGGRIRDLLLSRSLREGFADGTAAGSQMAFEMAHHDWLTLLLGASTFAFEFGFPLILLVRDTRLRLLFLLGVSGFHIANYYLVNVQFLWLPVVFLLFFDISKPLASRRARTAAA